ncbi:transcription termination factor MTEF1, chloroplastic [Cucurbita maxima]|uniref:Transcription termination factor MTEF1, chloroplastic n=1 Tax=Cucurbita maxima TaxID=3661 RepID=A0A6J1JEA2_CUCMA|nr:transcription termination factor MTEF1, chloroplastic [Cucurbita maxima]
MAVGALSHPFTTISSLSHSNSPTSRPPPSPPPSPPPFLNFRTAHSHNLRYLKSLRLLDSHSTKFRSPDAVHSILATVHFLKSKGFSDSDFPTLAFLCPQLFSPDFDPTDIAPVFDFLAADLSASIQESRGMILRCPKLLFSDVELCLRPTLRFLKQIGLENLNTPSNLKSHLLNTRVEKLRGKFRFLQELGFSHEEAAKVCRRMPALFGYSVEENLRPKYEYLVNEMERDLEELKEFPQYFAFSLERRIAPRHLHLKQRNLRIPLNRMLLWSDQKFYTKWK